MKKIIVAGFVFLVTVSLHAQEKDQFLSFTAGGGLHGLSYSALGGTQQNRLGYSFDIGYSYFFSANWGVRCGLGIQSSGARSTLNFQSAESATDADGDHYEFGSKYTNWQEKQQVLFLDIPLVAQYRRAVGKKIGLLGSLGVQLSVPVHSRFKTTGGEIVTTGYYSQWNVELSDLPRHGFTTITDSYNGELSLRPSYMVIADIGGLYTLSPKVDLYLGAYINYGLNNALRSDTKDIYQLDGVYNGMLASTQTTKLTPVSVGIKVGAYFHLAKKGK
jgi:OOP family OmpA-OmpF porin